MMLHVVSLYQESVTRIHNEVRLHFLLYFSLLHFPQLHVVARDIFNTA
jgi:hypothetical protein